jgi:transposase-like zinc-binding protein
MLTDPLNQLMHALWAISEGVMLEVAEIIRLHGAAYLARFADRILPSHRRALRDLEACRTPALGGHVHQCDHCGRQVSAFHSCHMESDR